jgi:hypothetical protein
VADFVPHAARLSADHLGLYRGGPSACIVDGLGGGLACLPDNHAERVTYLDIETCGLSGAPLFLVGLMMQRGDDIVIEQWLARNYAEEAAVLAAVNDRLQTTDTLVTFNGKTFDAPFIRERSFVAGLAPVEVAHHVDMLHESRRVFKRRFGNCKLQTLEYFVCGRPRVGDIPGALIPQVYHDFVRTGNARHIGDVLKHNVLDLVTMAELVVKLLEGLR